MTQVVDNGARFDQDESTSKIVQTFLMGNGPNPSSGTVSEMQKSISVLEARVEYMGTKADLQELRADFNKSMRDFQTECNGRFERLESKLQNILITMWVAIVGAFLTSIGIMASIIFGFPWEKFFAFKTWLEATF